MHKKFSALPSVVQLLKESFNDAKGLIVRLTKWQLLSTLFFVLSCLPLFLIFFVAIAMAATIESLHSPGIILAIGLIAVIVLLVAFFFISIVFSTTYFAVTIRAIAEYPQKSPLMELARTSWRKWRSFCALGLISFSLLGTLFFFVIPGIIVNILFFFAPYLIVLNDEKAWAAMKRSRAIWKAHGKELFFKLFLVSLCFSFIDPIIRFILRSAHIYDGQLSLFSVRNLILVIPLFLMNYFLNIMSSVYVIKVFKRVSATTPDSSNVRMQWIWIINGLGWILLGGLIALIVVIAQSSTGSETLEAVKKSAADELEERIIKATRLSSEEAQSIALETFALLNSQKQENNRRVLAQKDTLCQYAQKRADEFAGAENLEAFHEQFQKDMNDSNVTHKYIAGYTEVVELVYPSPSSTDLPQDFLSFWNEQTQDFTIIDNDYRAGCIVGTPDVLELIMAK